YLFREVGVRVLKQRRELLDRLFRLVGVRDELFEELAASHAGSRGELMERWLLEEGLRLATRKRLVLLGRLRAVLTFELRGSHRRVLQPGDLPGDHHRIDALRLSCKKDPRGLMDRGPTVRLDVVLVQKLRCAILPFRARRRRLDLID